ncbi:MAG: hypothetical protein KAH54_00495 [Candidatus Sabulitectum sp.]|nr:hypothetical protein [Candidatus Sabulitectum sp.]
MKRLTAVILLAVITVFSGCGDSATEIQGTLPVVTGIAVDTIGSTGDTIVVTWTAMDTTLVDGYFLWTRTYLENPWSLVAVCDNNAGTHIAVNAAFYTVMAFNGDDTSSDIGLCANTKTESISEIRERFTLKAPVGFRIDLEGDSLIAGDPRSADFAQHFTVAIAWTGERYLFPGSAYPELWPGGARTMISPMGGLVAPSPNDTINWKDSISYGGNFFLALDDGFYCMLKGSHTFPDTATMTDTLVLRGQVQPIMGVRVFTEQ